MEIELNISFTYSREEKAKAGKLHDKVHIFKGSLGEGYQSENLKNLGLVLLLIRTNNPGVIKQNGESEGIIRGQFVEGLASELEELKKAGTDVSEGEALLTGLREFQVSETNIAAATQNMVGFLSKGAVAQLKNASVASNQHAPSS